MLMNNKKYLRRKDSSKVLRVLVCLMFLLNGCNDFLDEVPDNRVALNNLDKASQVLTNAYSTASPAFTDWMTDDVGWTRGTTKRPGQLQAYQWEDVTADPTEQDTPIYFWFQTYDAIAHANEVLAVLDGLPADTDEEIARKRAVESEALLTRAFGHFMLVNLFAKHYNRQTAGSDPGIPYVEQPETVFIQQYERLSVSRVYDKIEEDLLRGLELVDDSFFSNSGKYHFNTNAALAFASRFYLYKGDFIRCSDFSSRLLGADPSAFVRDLTSREFQEAAGSITGYTQLYSSPDLLSNLLLIRKISLVQRTDFAFGPTNTFFNGLMASPFTNTSDTRQLALRKGVNASFPLRYESLFERSSLNSNTGFPYHIALAFRGEEVLLNRAEAYVIQNKIDDAIADLQVLVDNRYILNTPNATSPVLTRPLLRALYGVTDEPSITDQMVLFEYVLYERRKEFIAQGVRWFDIKRYGFQVSHDLEDGSVITLQQEDLRKVLQIPTTALDVGGLEPNPR